MITQETYDAIRKGAALLDQKEPGWRDRVSPSELKMMDCVACVVGQVLGLTRDTADLYYTTLNEWFGFVEDSYGHDWRAAREHGFMSSLGNCTYQELGDAWIGYIKGEWS